MAGQGCELGPPLANCVAAKRLQIVYVSIVGTVMLAALLEWFLWLAAFLYCLVKCFQKAETVSVKILSLIMMVLFTALRYYTRSLHCQTCN
jgi:hypothetical protein